MTEKTNEEMLDELLTEAFWQYEEKLFDSYPASEALSKEYPAPNKRESEEKVKIQRKEKKTIYVYLARAAVVFLCTVAVVSSVLLATPPVSASLKTVLVEWFDKYTVFSFGESTPGVGDADIRNVKIGYIPEYMKVDFDSERNNCIIHSYYSESDRRSLTVKVFENAGNAVLVTDREKTDYEKTEMNGNEAWIIYDENEGFGTVLIVGSRISATVSGDLEKSKLIEIAESIEKIS